MRPNTGPDSWRTGSSCRRPRHCGVRETLLFEDGLRPDGLRRLADAVTKTCGGRCAVFSKVSDGYQYAIGQENGNLRAFTKELNAALNGRGGGKPFFVQGSVKADRAEIEAFMNR